MKVLVVEDEDLLRAAAVDAFEDAGFEVIEAETGEQAVALCKDRAADALFTDIRLPGQIDGWDVAEQCRRIDPKLPVIYVTGYSLKEHRPVPGSRFFQKPYHAAQVIDAISDLLGRSPGRA
jgi:CheY-like chemotaxis protein